MERGGEEPFFRVEMGLDSRGIPAQFETLSPLFREMTICRWLGIDHKEFSDKPFETRLKWLFFEEMERRREDHFDKKEADRQRAEIARMRAEQQNKGIR